RGSNLTHPLRNIRDLFYVG
nr:RecName: Full=Pregnancy-associated glycoprotein 71G; AltName: Full=EbPAG-G 71 kDa [Bison bonasus]